MAIYTTKYLQYAIIGYNLTFLEFDAMDKLRMPAHE